MPRVLGLAIAVLFIALNGFFVAAEFALVKVRATQLTARIRRGEKRAILARDVIQKLERYLSVTQFGITLASLGLGWIGEPATTELMTDAFIGVTGHEPGRIAHVVAVVLGFGLLTFGHVLFGELVPKLVAIQRSEATALLVAGPLRVISFTFRPLLWVLERATGVILKAAGLSADTASEGTLSEDEILGILAADSARTSGGKAKRELLERVIRFSQRTARHAMVPRVDVASLPIDTSGAEALGYLQQQQYSRVLLTRGQSLDEVAGYLYAKDFLLAEVGAAQPNLWNVRRDVLFVPESQGLSDVLREMQRAHTPIAVVVDEYGGTSGLVTMEDLLEEIVGEIHDELDEEPAHIVPVVGQEAWDVDARTTLEELRTIGIECEDDELGEPVGSYVLAKLERLPRKGDVIALPNGTAEVMGLSRRRVTSVRVRVKAPASAVAEEAARSTPPETKATASHPPSKAPSSRSSS